MRIYRQAQQRPSACHSSRLCTVASQTNPELCRRNCVLCLLWQVQAQRHLMFNGTIASSHKHNPSVIIPLLAAAHDTPIQVHLRAVLLLFFFFLNAESDFDSTFFSIDCQFVCIIMGKTQDGYKQREEHA